MKTVCAKDMCAGCMACINMCKKSAITIVDDYKTCRPLPVRGRKGQCYHWRPYPLHLRLLHEGTW